MIDRIHQLERTIRLPISQEEAWEFFSDPRNLAEITPANMGFQVVSSIPQRIYPGLFIEYRLRPLLNLPATWVTEITHVIRPRLFVDEQRIGPYRLWHHEHHFVEIAGGVQVTDLVHYVLPFGPLGLIAARVIVRPRLEEIFDFRAKVLQERFGVLPASAPVPLSTLPGESEDFR